MASLAALATRNFTTFLAGILIAAPVAGLRPIRAFRSTRTSRPIPGNTNTPFFLTSADGGLGQRGHHCTCCLLCKLALLCKRLDDLRLCHVVSPLSA